MSPDFKRKSLLRGGKRRRPSYLGRGALEGGEVRPRSGKKKMICEIRTEKRVADLRSVEGGRCDMGIYSGKREGSLVSLKGKKGRLCDARKPRPEEYRTRTEGRPQRKILADHKKRERKTLRIVGRIEVPGGKGGGKLPGREGPEKSRKEKKKGLLPSPGDGRAFRRKKGIYKNSGIMRGVGGGRS